MSNQGELSDDWLELFMMGLFVFAIAGSSIAAAVEPARRWMVDHHLLEQGATVLIPLWDGAGLGWGQVLVVGALLTVVITLAVVVAKRSASRA